jgi:hypothetical protein
MAAYVRKVLTGALLYTACAAAVDAAPPVADEFSGYATASLGELDRVRGGFSLASGNGELQISIGIERAVFVDGVLKVSTKLDIPSLGSQIAGATNLAAMNIVQNGAGNAFIPASLSNLPSNVMTLVQNTLDNQTISNLNIINATVTSRDLLRSMAINSSVQEMLAGSIR